MLQRKWNALIIGCGNMGVLNDSPGSRNEHKTISFAKALKENGNFNLYFYDIDKQKEFIAMNIWDGRLLLGNPIIDVVIITTPDETHCNMLLTVASLYTPKLVICEKPFCSNTVEAGSIIELYEKEGIPILIDYTRNFIPELIALKERKPIKALCYFNRGWLHTATHGIAFFEMLDIKDYKIKEMMDGERYWSIDIQFEDDTYWHEQRIGDMPVPSYYDYHTRYVIDNAVGFLEGREELKCNMYDGLKTLEIMERLCI